MLIHLHLGLPLYLRRLLLLQVRLSDLSSACHECARIGLLDFLAASLLVLVIFITIFRLIV